MATLGFSTGAGATVFLVELEMLVSTLFDEVLPLVFDEIPLPAADLFPPISLDILPLVLGMACGIAGWVLETGMGPTLT